MRRNTLFLVTIFVSAVAVAQTAKEHGKQLFADSGCQHCHTIHKEGGINGPKLDSIGRTQKPDAIKQQILDGGKGMPPFRDVLNEYEVDSLVAYLRTLKAKK